MIAPFLRSFAAAVIGRKNQRGVAAIFGDRLRELPNCAEISIDAMRGVEIFGVLAGVRPVVGFAERNVEHFRML